MQEPFMRYVTLLIICITIAILFCGCTENVKTNSESSSDSIRQGAVPAQTSDTDIADNNAEKGTSYNFSGNGYQNTPHFSLNKGTAEFILTMNGTYYNGAILYDNRYVYINQLVDQINTGTITKSVDIEKPGDYFIAMNAPDGSWDVIISQSGVLHAIPVTGGSIPENSETTADTGGIYTYSGNGYANTPEFILDKGTASFELTMDGKYYNGAILYDDAYVFVDHLVDQSKSGMVSRNVEITKPGEYFIGMNAPDGEWKVKVTQT